MHIDSKAKIAGVSILSVRQFLRQNSKRDWGLGTMCQELKITQEEAKKLTNDLQAQEYIELSYVHDGNQYWHNTINGNALANSSAAKPIGREKADKAFSELLERVNRVNQDPYFLYKVVEVALFGSYITSTETVNDVDVAIELASKEYDQNRHFALCQQRREEATEKGTNFRNYSEYICWAEIEVWKFLKARSRVISIHPMKDVLENNFPHKIVYTEEKIP